MEVAKAKYFVCWDTFGNTLYKAKKLQTLFDEVELARDYIGLMANIPITIKIAPTMTQVKSTEGNSAILPPPPQCGIIRGINTMEFIVVICFSLFLIMIIYNK